MTEQRKRWLIILWALAVPLLACTLAAEGPPTLVPRSTEAPPPTIGYSTLSPTELPQEAATAIAQNANAIELRLAELRGQIEADRLMLHVRALQNFRTRHVNSTQADPNQGVGAARNYLLTQFQGIADASNGNLYVLPHDFRADWAGVQSVQTNVVGILTGTEIGAGTIVIGAHYDSRGDDLEDARTYAPGADDNGSGVAALIELARVLSREQHRATIVFVAFAAEEVGRQGSQAFVNDYIRAQNIDVTAMINLDTIGNLRGADGTINDGQMRLFSGGPNEGSASRQLARSIEVISAEHNTGMDLMMQDALDRPGRYGDHFSFEEAGYPSVRFIEGLEDTRYADSTDTIDGVHPDYLKRATQTVLSVVKSLADGPRPPRNITLRDNGDGTRTLLWEPAPGATSYVVALRRPDGLIYYQRFPVSDTSVRWDGFVPQQYAGLAVASVDSTGLMGPLSNELLLTN